MTRIVVIVVALIMITVSVVMKFSNEKARSNTKKRNASSPDWMCASTLSCIIEDYTSIPLSSVDLEGYEVQRNIRWGHGYSRYVLLELVRTSPFQGMRHFVRLVALRKTACQCGFEKIFEYEVSTYSEYPCWEVEQSELSWRNESGELQTITTMQQGSKGSRRHEIF